MEGRFGDDPKIVEPAFRERLLQCLRTSLRSERVARRIITLVPGRGAEIIVS